MAQENKRLQPMDAINGLDEDQQSKDKNEVRDKLGYGPEVQFYLFRCHATVQVLHGLADLTKSKAKGGWFPSYEYSSDHVQTLHRTFVPALWLHV